MAKAEKKHRLSGIIIICAVVAVIAVLIGVFASKVSNDIKGKNQGTPVKYTLVVEKSDFETQIGQKLKGAKIIVSDTVWTNWMQNHYPEFKYINGVYYLTSDMSYEDIAKKLQNPDISHESVKVTIPEGYDIFDIAKRLEENEICKKADFYKAVSTTKGYKPDFLKNFPADSQNRGFILEGFLFPATYDFAKNSKASDIVEEMLETFDDHLGDDVKSYCKQNNMSLYEFVTLASIVQKEALTKSSAANIASVLQNRLDRGTKLQCDVTYYYAKKLLDYGFSRQVYDSYYTYRCPALPAGPIANCGDDIIEAVVNHPKTDYLFFFSDLKGNFHFSSTSAEFEAQKEKYPWK